MIKLIDTPPTKLECDVNYFKNFELECHLLKIGYNKFNFVKLRRCRCNLPKKEKREWLL
jgi:hypothetical protein